MKSVCQLSLPGYIFSVICFIPCIVFCVMNKNKLPDICMSHMNAQLIPDGYLSREGFFWFSLLLPIGLGLFFDLLSLIVVLVPPSSFKNINLDYYRRNNRFNMLKSMLVNMTTILGSLVELFIFSILEPAWEYNIQCEINPDHPVPCEYKITVIPQIIIFILIFIATLVGFTLAISKRAVKDGLEDNKEDENWKCGCCYVNMDDDRVCVPKRYEIGWTINLGNSCGIALTITIIAIPILILCFTYLF